METTTTNRYTSNNTLIEKNINSVVTENNKKIIKNEKYIDYGNQLEKTNESTETIETNRTEIIEKNYENNNIKEEKTVTEKFQIGGIWVERNVKTKETYNNGILTFKNTSENDNTGFKEEEFVKYSEEERTKKIEDVSINGVNIRKEISITKNANGEVKEMRDYYKEYSKNDNNEIFYSKNIQQYNNSTEIFIEDKKVINGNEVSINTTEKYLNNSISSRETSTYYSSNGTTIIELTHFKSDGTIKEQLIKIVEANGKVSLYNKSNEISSKGDTKSYKMGVNTEMAYFGDGYNNSNFYKIASLENYSGFVTGYTKEDGSNGAQIQYTSNNINISPTNTGTTNIQSNTNISGNTLISGNSTVAGNSDITGDLNVNGNKNFRIDHPDDPENKYLLHSSIESDEVLNQYTGNIITDANGFATVTLADYIQKINIDFRYQLTVIGQFAQAIISNEIENNQFQIQTDKPNVKVSWLITAKRNDKYMQENPFVPVQLKNKTR